MLRKFGDEGETSNATEYGECNLGAIFLNFENLLWKEMGWKDDLDDVQGLEVFFVEQFTPLKNDSVLSVNQIFLTQSRLSSLDFSKDEILKIIRASNVYKAHDYDDISIRTM